jgi:hypothetical protein
VLVNAPPLADDAKHGVGDEQSDRCSLEIRRCREGGKYGDSPDLACAS